VYPEFVVVLRFSVKTLELFAADFVVPLVVVTPVLRRASVVPLLFTVRPPEAVTPEEPVRPPALLATPPPPAPEVLLLP